MPSRNDLAKIHIAIKDLAIADADYRAILQARYKVKSAAKLTERQAWDLLSHFKSLGWQPRLTGAGPAFKTHSSPDDPQSRKIRAMWITLGHGGAVHNQSELALNAYCKRMVGVDALRFATPAMKGRLIEFLKEWQRRDLVAVFGVDLPAGIQPVMELEAKKFRWQSNGRQG